MTRSFARTLSLLILSSCSIAIDRGIDGRDEEAQEGPGTLDEWTACDFTSNADAMTRTYRFSSLALPASNAIGFNIDRRASASSNLAGCGRVDYLPEGIDNSFVEFMKTSGAPLAETGIDIPGTLETDIDDGNIVVELEIHHWNGTASDGCVGLDLNVRDHGRVNTELRSSAAIEAGKIRYAFFEGSTTLTTHFLVDEFGLSIDCEEEETCEEVAVPMTLQGVRARFVFRGGTDGMARLAVDASPTNENSTVVGGFVRYTGTAASGAFKPGFLALNSPIVAASFPLFLDLDSTPSIERCISHGQTLSSDAFSIGFLAESE
jgi:hypothetical protein